jgi:hypothetical protein
VEISVINIAEQFTRFPAGRYRSDGRYTGQRFREEFLVPALRENAKVAVQLDGTMGYGSSFLEEAFGGLVRTEGFEPEALADKITLESRDASLISEIKEYLSAAHH